MQAEDFDLSENLTFDPEGGKTSFENNRMVLFNTEAIGLLRSQIVDSLGYEEARRLLLRFGFKSGYTDFLEMKTRYDWDSPDELLEVGPLMHTYEGVVGVEPTEMDFDFDTGEFYFRGLWHNSYEAIQHRIHHGVNDEPTCWSLMGYGSAWCSGWFGEPVLELEDQCVGMGDDTCEWVIKPVDEWGERADPYREALSDLFAEV